jgi:hypothetical protein
MIMPNIKRGDSQTVKDASLIPNNETDLPVMTIAIDDDGDQVVDLSSLGFYPLILLVRGDGDFYDGSNEPVIGNDLWRDAKMLWSIPVSGRQAWHFKHVPGVAATHLYIKVLGSNSTP